MTELTVEEIQEPTPVPEEPPEEPPEKPPEEPPELTREPPEPEEIAQPAAKKRGRPPGSKKQAQSGAEAPITPTPPTRATRATRAGAR